MKDILSKASLLLIVGLALTACTTSDSGGNATTSASGPDAKDIAACEQNTKAFLASDYTGDNSVPVRYMTKEFAKLWLWACNPPPGNTNYWGADPILETQDMDPTLVRLGPGIPQGLKVHVPVVYEHHRYSGQPSRLFTKTFVFERTDGSWRISDIISSGADILRPGSEVARLSKDYGKSW